jgi:hypothetical protein
VKHKCITLHVKTSNKLHSTLLEHLSSIRTHSAFWKMECLHLVGIPFSKMPYIVFYIFPVIPTGYLSDTHQVSGELENKNHRWLHHVMPSAMGIIRIRPASALPHRGPYFGNAYRTHNVKRTTLKFIISCSCSCISLLTKFPTQ